MSSRSEYAKHGWRLIGEASALECEDERASEDRFAEVVRIVGEEERRAEQARGVWLVTRYRIDRAGDPSRATRQVVFPGGVLGLIDGADAKNGVDMAMAVDGAFVLIVYGQRYTDVSTGESGTVTEVIECRLVDGNSSLREPCSQASSW